MCIQPHSVLGLVSLLLQVPQWDSGPHEGRGDGPAPAVPEGGDSVPARWVPGHIKDLISERVIFGPGKSLWAPWRRFALTLC